MDFVLLNESTETGMQYGGELTPAILTAIAAALQTQANRDVAPYYGGTHTVTVGDKSSVKAGQVVCAIVDDLPDAPGAVAYHDQDGKGVPTVFLARHQCNSLTTGNDSVSSALSHEVCEALGDPACNRWVDDGKGTMHALEACDAVQESGYAIDGIAVSNFLLPAYFDGQAPAPYDYLGTPAGGGQGAVSVPFQTAPGGYQLVQQANDASETQVTGELSPRRRAKKRHWSSRSYRRGFRA